MWWGNLRDCINNSMDEYSWLSKEKIVEYGSDYVKELDSSLTKTDMIEQLKDHIKSLTTEQLAVLELRLLRNR